LAFLKFRMVILPLRFRTKCDASHIGTARSVIACAGEYLFGCLMRISG
jgi:hypothetical protein